MAPRSRKPPLRAVGEGETGPAKPVSVAAAVRDGTTRDVLERMRERIARAVDDPKCPPVALAALTNRLDQLTEKLDALAARAAQEGEHGELPGDEAFDASAI